MSVYFIISSLLLFSSPFPLFFFSSPHFHVFSFFSSFFSSSFEPLLFFFYLLLNLNLFLFYLEIIEIIIGERGCPHWCLLYVVSFNPGIEWEGDREWVWVCVRERERDCVCMCGRGTEEVCLTEKGWEGKVVCVRERGYLCNGRSVSVWMWSWWRGRKEFRNRQIECGEGSVKKDQFLIFI